MLSLQLFANRFRQGGTFLEDGITGDNRDGHAAKVRGSRPGELYRLTFPASPDDLGEIHDGGALAGVCWL
jgi:hypothetical protein